MMKKGFSIIEVLVAMSLLGIVAAGITAVITNSMKQQRGIQAKDHRRELTSTIRTFLANKTACTNTFIGKNPVPEDTVPVLKDALNAPKYTLTNDSTGQLKFDEFKVTEIGRAHV